jgi:S1-C subfamily serine protease
MNAIDLALVLGIVVFAVVGWRRGFLYGLFSLLGFLIGASFGLALAPRLLRSWDPGWGRAVVAVVVVLFAAILGQLVVGYAGKWLSDRVTWRPAEVVDSLAGALLSVMVMLLVAWLVAALAVGIGADPLTRQVRMSSVLDLVDNVMPSQAQEAVGQIDHLIQSSGFPQVFAGLGAAPIPPVASPDPAVLRRPGVRSASAATVKVVGTAPSCARSIEGSGFVFAPERVMTNAHVVAGVEHPTVSLGGASVRATVVYFDPSLDLAVLDVPGLKAKPLVFQPEVAHGAPVVVIGFPENGPLVAQPARVRAVQSARGNDIYDKNPVLREVLSLRAQVYPGNSGGPVVDSAGRVVGVVFADSLDSPDTAYAISANQAMDAVASGAGATSAVRTGGCT